MSAKNSLLIAALIQIAIPLPASGADQSDAVVFSTERARGPEEATATYRFRCRDKIYIFEFAKKPLGRLELISATPIDGAGLDRLKTALAEMGQVDRVDADCSNTEARLRLILTRYPEGSGPTVRTWSPDPRHRPIPMNKDR